MSAETKGVVLGGENPHVAETAMSFAHASEVLAIEVRNWTVLPPRTPAELEFAGSQLEGLRRGLGDLRTAMLQK